MIQIKYNSNVKHMYIEIQNKKYNAFDYASYHTA